MLKLSLGIRCLFPFLSDPLWELLSQLSAPFVVLALLALSVGIAELMSRWIRSCGRTQNAVETSALDSSLIGSDTSLLMRPTKEVAVKYPASAFLASLSITVIKFFYFGTSLTAHQYLFSGKQAASGVKYIQNNPWIKSSAAKPMIMASIPSILIFDFGLPLAFILACWKFRNRFTTPSVQIYFGSLFETYHPRCYWWEIVRTLQKLSLALVLKALPASDAAQGALAVSILAGTQIVQLSLNPWRRKTENVMDGISSLLLIGALMATRPGGLTHAPGVTWYILALSVVFVVASIGVIGWQAIYGRTDYQVKLQAFLNDKETYTGIPTNAPNDSSAESLSEWSMAEEGLSADDSTSMN